VGLCVKVSILFSKKALHGRVGFLGSPALADAPFV
jgi:hypothetical protein